MINKSKIKVSDLVKAGIENTYQPHPLPRQKEMMIRDGVKQGKITLIVTNRQTFIRFININYTDQQAISMFRVVVTRLYVGKILEYLEEVNEPKTATEIYIKLRIEQSECSQALNSLRELGLVYGEARGKNIYYSFNPKGLMSYRKIIDTMKEHLKMINNQAVEQSMYMGDLKRGVF